MTETTSEIARLQAELAELRITMAGDSRERLDQIQAERDAMSKDERARHEAADAPMLRIQLACLAGENRRLRAERDALNAANERAQALHVEAESNGGPLCEHCTDWAGIAVGYPCPTLRALNGTESPEAAMT